MSASMTGIKFDWIDGVNGDAIPEKAIPQVSKSIPGEASDFNINSSNQEFSAKMALGMGEDRNYTHSRLLESTYERNTEVSILMC